MAPLLDLKDAAKILGACPETIARLVRARRLPCIRVGRLIRFREEDLQEWANKQIKAYK